MLAPREQRPPSRIRSIFISDTHLGSRFCRADALLKFLRSHQPDHLYLVGDFIDGWALRRSWHWPPIYTAILNRLIEMAEGGTEVLYTPGNHDNFLRQLRVDHPLVTIQDEFVHTCANGQRMLVLHGDQFDRVESHNQWLSHLGSVAYDCLLLSDRGLNAVLFRCGLPAFRLSRLMKQSVKRVVQFISGFENKALTRATEANCDGTICGHIHVPKDTINHAGHYINLGDWIENCTALVEHPDGRLELLDLEAQLLPMRSAPRVVRPILAPLRIAGTMLRFCQRTATRLLPRPLRRIA